MIATVLDEAGLDPTYLIGGDLNESGSGARAGRRPVRVRGRRERRLVPADGSRDRGDHERRGRSRRLLSRRRGGAPAGVRGVRRPRRDGRGLRRRRGGGRGGPARRRRAGRLRHGSLGRRPRDDRVAGTRWRPRVLDVAGASVPLALSVDGAHNLLDAAAAVAVGGLVGVPADEAARGLATFRGVRRRFERRGGARGADFFDDYAHVPTELAVTLDVARRRGPGRLIAVFQPHRYSRTQALWRELGASLTEADVIVITDVRRRPAADPRRHRRAHRRRRARRGARSPRLYAPHAEEAIGFLARRSAPTTS